MIRSVCAVLALAATGTVAAVHAESLSYEDLHVRDRVLIVALNDFEIEGFVIQIEPDTLFIVPIGKGARDAWPVKDIAQLRLYLGQESMAWDGFVYGAVAGLVAGFVWGRATGGGSEESNPWEKKDNKSMIGGMLGFGIGGFTGLSIGSFIEKARWETVRILD